jgi:type IV pilus assembly protein PilY1
MTMKANARSESDTAMNATNTLKERAVRFLRSLFCVGLGVWMLGAPYAAQAAVPVDQSPLIIQQPIPPNIVLMLDDSGSMEWDYMPDKSYIADTSDDGMRYYGNNGTYYNPNLVYVPPSTADGGSYPQSPGLGNAFRDGFLDQSASHEEDVTQYYGSYRYYEHLTAQVPTSYKPTLGCAPGDYMGSGSHQGECVHRTGSYYTYRALYPRRHGRGTPYCYAGDQLVLGRRPYCIHNDYTYTYYAPNTQTCPSGGTYDSSQGMCVASSYDSVYVFTYTTPNGSGGYVRHYVAKTQQDCTTALAADTSSGVTCDSSAATQQSVANWFSYYRTRIEMAKSGLMNSFVDIGPSFRIGFGSINGRNNANLPSPTSTYNYKEIAQVQPFGDGTSGTQKAKFWDWLAGINPSNSTPLRLSLDAVGQYYSSAQPWQTSSSDSSELACRQSYAILTTDGFWNGGSPGLGNVDGNDGSKIDGSNGQSYTYKAVPPYADDQSDTLADVAMKYWSTDLRTNTSNEVPPSTEDPAFWQHMTTFTLGLGFKPEHISPSGTTVDDIFTWANGGAAISGFSWPNASSNDVNNIADLAHAAVNGHGGFYSATTPQAFTSGLQDALKRAAERVGTGASLAANSTELKTGTVAYQANYYTVKWKGDLKALSVDANTGAISSTPTWQAANKMPLWSSRNIYTYNPSGSTASAQYVKFSDPSKLSTAEQAALGLNATEQQNLINYLRGDESLEEDQTNGIYRTRDTVLGDIVDSQPVYVGSPVANQFYGESFTGSVDYPLFATNNENRTALVYLAANDGMLHAFDAATGVEKFAYLPGAVITSGLASLADPKYGTGAAPHQYFNDGELTVADVYMNGAWHTVLVGTTGRGLAKAVYALDITDPSNIKLLWERSAGDGQANSGYIGQMVGKPVIAQTSDGNWSVLIGNGYNSTNGVAALLQFDLSTGGLSVHLTSDTSTNNGMSAPAVWIDNPTNGVSTMAYAGDLDGHVWSFALQNNGGNKATPDSTGTLLFTAKDASGNIQPITGGLLAGKNPTTNDVWLFFGTGRYLSSSDLTDLSTQTWYGIIAQSATTSLVSNLSSGRSALVQRQIIGQTPGDPTASPPTLPARVVTPPPSTSDMTGKSGWYMDLLAPIVSASTGATSYIAEGERMVTPNQFQGNVLLGTTRIPQAKDLCNPSGSGWIMAVDPFTGTNPVSDFFDVNGNGQINSGDSVTINGKTYASAGVGFSSLPNNPIFVGGTMLVSFDNGTTGSLQTSGSTGGLGRVSWRELTTQ